MQPVNRPERGLANDAMRSDAKAMKLLLALVDRYAQSTEAKVQLGELLAEDQEILTQYLPESRKPEPKPPETPRNLSGSSSRRPTTGVQHNDY